jgi:hypothetical protein
MTKASVVRNVLFLVLFSMLSPSLPAQTWQDLTANVPGAITGGNQRPIETDGTRLYVLGNRGVYVSADNGASFTPINDVAGASYSLTNIGHRFLRYVNGSVWIGSDPGSGAFNLGQASLHRLTPGQTVWQKSSNGFPIGSVDNQADDIAFDASTGTYYVAAAIGGVFVSSNGTDWEQRVTGLGGLGLPASIVAFNGKAFSLRPGGKVYRTTNQGANWTALNSHPGPSSGFLLEKNGRVMFSTSGNNALEDGFYYTDDDGATWNFTFSSALKLQADLTDGGNLIYAAGTVGGLYASVYGHPGFKFSATQGLTWDLLATNGLTINPTLGFTANRIVRQGNYLFMHSGTSLQRLDVASFDFTPSTQIARQPATNINRLVGQSFTLDVLAGGTNLTYQWRLHGTNIGGATAVSYAVAAAQTNQSGPYTVVVSGDRGSVTSAVSTVTVVARIEGKADITYNSSKVGGQLFLLPDLNLISVSGATLTKLDPDGALVTNRTIASANFTANLVDSSNRVLLGGTSTGNRLRRVSATGFTDDATFNQLTANGAISAVAELPGRGYLVGGNFTSVTNAGISTNAVTYLCLVNYSGVFDPSFSVGNAPNGGISRIVVESGTNIYVLGTFNYWNGVPNNPGFVKLNLNGTQDPSFTPFQLAANQFLRPIAPGKLFAVELSGKPVLMNLNGSLDGSFNTANHLFNTGNTVRDVAVGESNKLYVVGTFTSYGGTAVGRYLRLNSNGTRDTTFDSSVGPTSGGLAVGVYDPRGYLHVVRDTSSGSFQGFAFNTGPYRVFAGTNAASASGFAAWKSQFTFPPGLDGETADADGDGISNVFEFYFGSNPTNSVSGSKPALVEVEVTGVDYPAITFVRSQSAAGITLVPQASSNALLTDSLGTVLHSVVDLGGGLEQVTIRSAVSMAAQPAQFLTIKLSVP